MQRSAQITILAWTLFGCAGSAAAATTDAVAQPAKWVSRTVDFTYQGFTTQYTCDGLREEVVTILHALGARKQDMKVDITPCAALGTSQISLSPGVRGTISVLVPATAEEVTRGDPGIVPAHWKPVDLMRSTRLDNEHGGEYELLEQSKRYLLPMFATRSLEFTSNCVPHDTFSGGMTFKVEVLKPDPKA